MRSDFDRKNWRFKLTLGVVRDLEGKPYPCVLIRVEHRHYELWCDWPEDWELLKQYPRPTHTLKALRGTTFAYLCEELNLNSDILVKREAPL